MMTLAEDVHLRRGFKPLLCIFQANRIVDAWLSGLQPKLCPGSGTDLPFPGHRTRVQMQTHLPSLRGLRVRAMLLVPLSEHKAEPAVERSRCAAVMREKRPRSAHSAATCASIFCLFVNYSGET